MTCRNHKQAYSVIPDGKGKEFSMKYKKTTMAARSAIWVCALIVGLSFAYSDASGASLKATPEQFDFGTVAEGTPAEVTAIVQNTGDTPVEITNVRTS